ncbi:hypothetical protein HPOKI154_03285 [Helicobacter pylori oki154]|nr:hypothetical protein HPOKI154_03285 [Helicobacter pylori oki154]AHN44151.1 hypothetical protein HPOKI828_03275 [Helicobacter pylori oki828]
MVVLFLSNMNKHYLRDRLANAKLFMVGYQKAKSVFYSITS